VSTATPFDEQAPPERPEPAAEPARTGFVESILDNLPVWTVIAAAISFLYLVWATLEILSRYLGGIPRVSP